MKILDFTYFNRTVAPFTVLFELDSGEEIKVTYAPSLQEEIAIRSHGSDRITYSRDIDISKEQHEEILKRLKIMEFLIYDIEE